MVSEMLSSRRHFLSSSIAAASFSSFLRGASGVSVGMIPDAGATQVAVEQKAPLRDYLSKTLGEPVNLIIPTNYNATVEALGNSTLDFAYLGALTYVKAHDRYGVAPLVQRASDKNFHSVFITAAGSNIQKLIDIKGRQFAFGDINSTSGHLMPFAEMKKAGIDPDRDLQFRYTGSHPATAKAVESGGADAGALDETVYSQMLQDGKLDKSKVRIFFTSEPFVDYVWVARKEIDAGRRKKFADAFLSLKEGRDDQVLGILRGKNFITVSDSEYDKIRRTAAELKLL